MYVYVYIGVCTVGKLPPPCLCVHHLGVITIMFAFSMVNPWPLVFLESNIVISCYILMIVIPGSNYSRKVFSTHTSMGICVYICACIPLNPSHIFSTISPYCWVLQHVLVLVLCFLAFLFVVALKDWTPRFKFLSIKVSLCLFYFKCVRA